MDTRKVEDVSCFFLVEATGDSEVSDDTDPNMLVIDPDDDDAESCSCDVSEYHSCVSDLDGCEVVEEPTYVNNFLIVEEDKEKEAEEVHVYQKWNSSKGHTGLGLNQKSCASVESTDESMNEMEKSRLFWEACLAS